MSKKCHNLTFIRDTNAIGTQICVPLSKEIESSSLARSTFRKPRHIPETCKIGRS